MNVPPTVRIREVCSDMPSEAEIMEQRLAYGEKIAFIDHQIGRILDLLDALGVMESTTIIFSADHGELMGDYRLNAKGPFPYRAQLEIPLILANHPSVRPGTRSVALAGNLDIAGTLLDIAGDDRPIGMSRSLLDLAQPTPLFPRQVNFSEFCDSIKTAENKRYRFCYYPLTRHTELYDIQQDRDETTNLADRPEYATICAVFLQHIIDFLLIAKGVRVEAHDFVPEQQEGLKAKYRDYERDFPIAYPLSAAERVCLQRASLPDDFNEFCKEKPLLRCYGEPYWMEDAEERTSS